jgi:hypothetical protein
VAAVEERVPRPRRWSVGWGIFSHSTRVSTPPVLALRACLATLLLTNLSLATDRHDSISSLAIVFIPVDVMQNPRASKSTVHPDYPPTSETDVVLRATDGTLFHLAKARLKYHCADGFPAAYDMSESSTPGSDNPDVVDMTECRQPRVTSSVHLPRKATQTSGYRSRHPARSIG